MRSPLPGKLLLLIVQLKHPDQRVVAKLRHEKRVN